MEQPGHAETSFRILHVLRAPVGGLFRHVLDLTREQVARGHKVGLVTDSRTGGEIATDVLNQLKPSLALGLLRLPMSRQPNPLDFVTALKIGRHARTLNAGVIHGHGAKGGLYGRFPALRPNGYAPIRIYTPHGGSFSTTMTYGAQRFYMFVEWMLAPFTDAYLFESTFVARRFDNYVGKTHALTKIIPNGIGAKEFRPIAPLPGAADLLYVGELRRQKGIDLLIDSMIELTQRYGDGLRLLLVGHGPDKERFVARAAALGLEKQVAFKAPMPASEAFQQGRILVLPSRSESFPYIILEAAGAQLPIVATDVGDIRKILSLHQERLVPPNDRAKLVSALSGMLDMPPATRQSESAELAKYVAERFTVTTMVDSVLGAYREAIELKSTRQSNSKPSFAILS